jgi:hypothetical protein
MSDKLPGKRFILLARLRLAEKKFLKVKRILRELDFEMNSIEKEINQLEKKQTRR